MTANDLTRRREALGLSQRALARICGVHFTSVYRWEHNHRRVPNWVSTVLDTLEKEEHGAVNLLDWLLRKRDYERSRDA